jgi:hypothetical protein
MGKGKVVTMQAIETRYNGYRFRSRLEARWAVYFDTLGIKYVYEPDGFTLSDGSWYLPDFWLPQVSMFAEVKPAVLTIAEITKCVLLTYQTGVECLMLDGPVEMRHYWSVSDDYNLDSMPDYNECSRLYVLGNYYLDTEHRFYCCPGAYDDFGKDYDAVLKGVNAARAARFEHGENGLSQSRPVALTSGFRDGQKVRHPTFGEGLVLFTTPGRIGVEVIVVFPKVGVKRFPYDTTYLEVIA